MCVSRARAIDMLEGGVNSILCNILGGEVVKGGGTEGGGGGALICGLP